MNQAKAAWKAAKHVSKRIDGMKEGTVLDSSAFKAAQWGNRGINLKRLGLLKPVIAALLGIGGGVSYGKYRWNKALNQLHIDKNTPETRLTEIYREIDANADGAVTPAELVEFLQKRGISLSAEDVAAMMEICDQSQDGVFSLQEWLSLVRDKHAVCSEPAGQVAARESGTRLVYDHRSGFSSLIRL